jgi:hypothetical protein
MPGWARPVARGGTGTPDRSIGSVCGADDTDRQRDLSVSNETVGDVLEAQGDLPGALAAYRKALAITETLAARDPGNTDWQRDISISLRMADTLLQMHKQAEARLLAERALKLLRVAVAGCRGDALLIYQPLGETAGRCR